MNQHNVDQRKLDPVAEVLKDLSAGKNVPRTKAEVALAFYNNVVAKTKEVSTFCDPITDLNTVNPLYNGIRYNSKIRYNVN